MEPVISLEKESPEEGEELFVWDACWGEWFYSTYEGKRDGKHQFCNGHNSYGEEQLADKPTHFWRVTLPEAPAK